MYPRASASSHPATGVLRDARLAGGSQTHPSRHPGGPSCPCPDDSSVEAQGGGCQGAATRITRHRVGPAELDGRIKDRLREAISAHRAPQKVREDVAEQLGTTAGEIKKVLEPTRALRLPAHWIPAFDRRLGEPVALEVLADAAGYLIVPLPEPEAGGEVALCDLLLSVGDAAGDLAHEIRDARRSTSAGGRSITLEEVEAIERAGREVLRAYYALMNHARIEAEGCR